MLRCIRHTLINYKLMLLSLLKTRFALTEDAAVTGLSHSPLNEKTTELL